MGEKFPSGGPSESEENVWSMQDEKPVEIDR